MHFDTGNFCAALLHHVIDMVNVVIFNDTEYTAHTSNDTALFAVMDIISADNMASHIFL